MPIPRKQVKAAGPKTTSTHSGNGGDVKIEQQSTDSVENNMDVDTLIDPEDVSHGSTHSMGKLTAGAKPKSKTSAKVDQQNVGTIDNDEDPAEGVLPTKSVTTAETDEQNVGTLDNDEDPAAGVLPTKSIESSLESEDGEDGEGMEIGEDEEVEASFEIENDELDPEDLENNNGVQQTLEEADVEGEDSDEDWNTEEDDTMSDIAEDEAAETEEPVDAPEAEDEPVGEALPLLDVDETPDTDTKEVAYAAFGTRLLVIRANRIIASMTKKMATASDRADIYLSDQFQEVVASEIQKKGLRKGLKSMGFALATVNVSKASVVNTRVRLEANKLTAAVRKVAQTKEQAFQQSLTIAAVGINRRFFKDVEIELKAHLEQEFKQLGVRGADKIIGHAFATFGPAYAKSIVELASKIAEMPQESRNGYVAALDLTSEDAEAADEDVVPVGFGGGDADNNEDFEDEFEDDTVEGSMTLASPGYRNTVKASPMAAGKLSVAASAILSGELPLSTTMR